MNLRLATRLLGNVLVVDCHGRIVFGEETLALRELVKEQLKNNKNLIINLADVNFIDSGGLGTLVGLYTSARSVGGTVKLAHLTRRVDELLQVTKLLTVFETYDSVEAAARSFPQGAVA